MDLKRRLRAIRENGFDLEGYDVEDLCAEMMDQIGTTDSVLSEKTLGKRYLGSNPLKKADSHKNVENRL